MATIIEMPKLSDTMTVGTLVNWLKKEGETVSSGDMIAEVETDKATMELEAFEDGVLLKQLVAVGDEVPVGQPIAAIGKKGEAFESSASSAAPAQNVKEARGDSSAAETAKEEPEKKSEPVQASKEAALSTPPVETATSGRAKVSPLARKLATARGISLEGLQGSGPAGRIVKKDILQAADGKDIGRKASPALPNGAPPSSAGKNGFPNQGDIAEEKRIAVSSIRNSIARRLLESKTQIPHFYLETEVDVANLLEVRLSLNLSLAELPVERGGGKLSVNDFIMKASAEALRRVPAVNCSWTDDGIQQHPSADVSFAVAIEDGLITPIIRKAHLKTLRQISAETRELAGKAKNKKLKPDEFIGGTFCVSNLGMFGIDRFSAIINPPNAAILAVGQTMKKPVVNAGNEIVIGHRMSLTLSCDHRVVDGAIGAQYLAALKELLEKPALMLV